jgi:hypothetical protein
LPIQPPSPGTLIEFEIQTAVVPTLVVHRLPSRQGGQGVSPKPRTLFGDLVNCGGCGAPISAISARLYGCTSRKERGPTVCEGVFGRRDLLDQRLVSAVRDELFRRLQSRKGGSCAHSIAPVLMYRSTAMSRKRNNARALFACSSSICSNFVVPRNISVRRLMTWVRQVWTLSVPKSTLC